MCGRYQLKAERRQVASHFDVDDTPEEMRSRYNISPTQMVPVVKNNYETNERELVMHKWGLIPFWAKDSKIGFKMINARSETVLEKPAFRNAFKKQRCIVPADGLYEWKRDGKNKTPFSFTMKDDSVFGFAGMWERWKSPDGQEIHSCCILTTSPNELMADVHDRMPVILRKRDYQVWLDASAVKPDELVELLVPYDADEMKRHEVSSIVNNARNETPECAAPKLL
jgi:putative SOS response-associated peptidase YedK